MLKAMLKPLIDIQNAAYQIANRSFNVDVSEGFELDEIGRWVGVSRDVYPPIGGVYFTWNGPVEVGWGRGIWKRPGDPITGLVSLPDYAFRSLIKAKIVANSWDGTPDGAYDAWDIAFNKKSAVKIIDYQDMSIAMIFTGEEFEDPVIQAILRKGVLPLKPAGVRVNYKVVDPTKPAFAWNEEDGERMGGWEYGYWTDVRFFTMEEVP